MSARGRAIAAVALRRFLLAAWQARFGLRRGHARRRVFARHLRLACEELGPTFIKLGQLASVRPDVFSPETVFELERLQDRVPEVPGAEIEAILAAELGAAPEKIFSAFELRPTATASIAQVHQATLAQDYRPVSGAVLPRGSRLAVKIIRPGIETFIAQDLALARRWAGRLARLPGMARLRPGSLLEEFRDTLASELDLRNEGRVADRFARDFADDPLVVVPRVIWRHTTRRVLTTEFVEGWRLNELGEAERSGIDARRLAAHGAEVFMRQVLVHGRYHADLHPANLFVTPDSRICYLDFGIVGRTTPAERIAIAQVLAATVYGDAERALRYSRELGLEVPEDKAPAVQARVADLMKAHLAGREQADVRGFALGFLSMLADFRIPIPEGYGLLVKALITVEGVARAIYPDIDIIQSARPFATRLIAAQLSRPERLHERAPAALKAALRELLA
ncbi:MAG TPA: AarF/UbiB family protein [Gammaproteobacteria bacterium]|nr:AarF/UbiB family protein [Gammaproteobacteria bacterium]